MSQSTNQEKELTIFARLTPAGLARLKKLPYRWIEQVETLFKLPESEPIFDRITVRGRATTEQGADQPVYEYANKFRAPDKQDGVSNSWEIETVCTEKEFIAIAAIAATHHRKRRIVIVADDFPRKIEVDLYLTKDDYFSNDIKIDVEKGSPDDYEKVIEVMQRLGIYIKSVLNPPEVKSPEIGQVIQRLVREDWNCK